MIKIIAKGRTHFKMTCSCCDTKYSYDIEDLGQPIINSSIVFCPTCGMGNYHYQRDAEVDDNIQDMVDGLEQEICDICENNTKCDGGTCIMSRRTAWGLLERGWRKTDG